MRPSSTIASKEVRYDSDVQQAAWDFILENHDALHRLARRMSRGDKVLEEDIMSDVVPTYVPAAINTWDPTKRSLQGHVMYTVRMYAWKYSNYRHSPGDVSVEVLSDSGYDPSARLSETDMLELREEVGYILELLPPYERGLLSMYHLCGLTHEEMAGVLEVSKHTARLHYHRALEVARDVIARHGVED